MAFISLDTLNIDYPIEKTMHTHKMKGTLHIFSTGEEHTTARYFERAILETGTALVYWDCAPDIDALGVQDILLYVDPAPDWPLGIERARCTTVAYLIDVHQDLRSRIQAAQFFDAIFVAQKNYVPAFLDAGIRHAFWLPLACDPAMYSVPSGEREFDVGFVGKLGQPGSWRHKTLSTVLPAFRTNDYRRFYSPIEMANVYSRSKIVFNASINGDLNMRFFEALISGALLVTDRIDNGVNELFQEGIHYIGYSTADEAIERIEYYLNRPSERLKIATEGQREVLAKHTYLHRYREMAEKFIDTHGHAQARQLSKTDLANLYSDMYVILRRPWRIIPLALHFRPTKIVACNFIVGWGRWLNAKIPFTPNAIRSRFRAS